LVLFLLPLVMGVTLFYARPWFATGNPFYPYFAGLFTDREAALATSQYHHAAGKLHFGPTWNTLPELGLLFFATPLLLGLGSVLDVAQGPASVYDGYLGLQLFAHLFLVGAIFWDVYRRRLRSRLGLVEATRAGSAKAGSAATTFPGSFRIYLGLALLLYIFWFFTSQQARFLLPVSLCVLLAASCAQHLLTGMRGKIVLAAVLALTMLSFPPQYILHFIGSWLPLVDNTITPLTLLQSKIGDHYVQACQGILNNTPADAKVLLLYEQRGLYVPRAYLVGTPGFQERLFTSLERNPTEEDFLETFRTEHITHVLVAFDIRDPDRMEKYMREAEVFLAPIYKRPLFGNCQGVNNGT
jgi:hypothetical protein